MLLVVTTLLPSIARASILGDFFAAITGTQTVQASSTAAGSRSNSTSSNTARMGLSGGNLQTSAALTPATNSDPSPASSNPATVVDSSALMPQEGPSGTIADIQKTKNGVISVYIVKPGDTLSGIAAHYGVTQGTILGANNLTPKSVIKPGDHLIIMPIDGIQYTVKKGDTLDSIAKRFNSDAIDIGDYNDVDNSTLVVGSQITIPGGQSSADEPTTPPPTTTPTTTGGKKPVTTKPAATVSKPVVSTKILEGALASCDDLIAMANNPAEPARGVGAAGTCAQIAYYTSPLTSFIQTQNIHGWNAVDLAAPSGTPIMAAADGEVIIAKQGGWNGGYGSYVVINHSNGSQTLYSHMSSVAAVVGEEVVQGQVIGYVGRTGDATGPHLHFEIRNGIRNPF